jgi:hypothetical protein
MLKLAVKAGIPLIGVTTSDPLNMPLILHHVTGKKPRRWSGSNTNAAPNELYYYIADGKQPLRYDKLYDLMVKAESSIVVANSPIASDMLFPAGEMPVPKDLLKSQLMEVFDDEATVDKLLPTLGGCTMKDSVEFIRLTMARDKSLTPEGLMVSRKTAFRGSRGITLVDTSQTHYAPPQGLLEWVEREGPFFLHEEDLRLVPRGLMFGGIPGTGKTEGAKWIAQQWGIPLYRVDIGGMRNKYVGESEQNMTAALSQLDHEEPCVALFDEIEKIFSKGTGSGDSGTTTTMLSQLLWWLAERRSRVLCVMTCNNRNAIPAELYRDGRIDDVVIFNGLSTLDQVSEFAKFVAAGFGFEPDELPADAFEVKLKLVFNTKSVEGQDGGREVSHAAVKKGVIDLIKEVKAK